MMPAHLFVERIFVEMDYYKLVLSSVIMVMRREVAAMARLVVRSMVQLVLHVRPRVVSRRSLAGSVEMGSVTAVNSVIRSVVVQGEQMLERAVRMMLFVERVDDVCLMEWQTTFLVGALVMTTLMLPFVLLLHM
jgi:hypothetical protein